jgi:hypothetical protein
VKRIVSGSCFWLLIIGLLLQIGAGFGDYKNVFQNDNFLAEAIFQIIETDLDNDQIGELVITGKNYTSRELFIFWVGSGAGFSPEQRWQSSNLYEDLSLLWVASGRFTSTEKNQLLVLTNTQLSIYQVENGALILVMQIKHNLPIMRINAAVTGGDIDGDGRSELVFASIYDIGLKALNGKLQAWRFGTDGLQLIAESGPLQNIRSITAGDLDGDGKAEIFADEGPVSKTGNLHMLALNSNRLTERFLLRNAAKGAIYAQQVKTFPEGVRLVTATDNGRVNSFSWTNNALIVADRELALSYGLVALAASDLNGDKIPEICLAAYPRRFIILAR